jgi:hypothetical protein
MVKRNFMRKNNLVIVYPYSEMRISHGRSSISHRTPDELHLYPGLQLMCVIGVEQL